MAKRGAQPGNNNSAKNKPWSEIIRRVALSDKTRLKKIAEALIEKCLQGDIAALKEFGDRFEGRVPQSTEVTGANGGSIILKIDSSDSNL